MNIDGSNLSEIFDISNSKTKNASVQGNSAEFAKSTGAFFDGRAGQVKSAMGKTSDIAGKNSILISKMDDENVIKSSENTKDAYDRIVNKADVGETSELVVTGETLKQIAEAVTPEKFSKYEELGIIADKDSPQSILTVSERIDIELATHCDNYTPVGDFNISDLEEMYGARASQIKETLDKIQNLQPISREASEYLLVNDMDLSVDNVYTAEHSVNNSSNSSEKYEKLSDEEWNELYGQIEDILNKNGFDINDENMSNAKWLIEDKIPVTAANLYKLSEIDVINQNISNNQISENGWIQKIALNMSYGLSAGSTSANYYSDIKSDSIEAVEIIHNGTDEQIETLVTDGKEVTLLNMKRQEEDTSYKYTRERTDNITDEMHKKIITERKNLEELRLKMTVEASALMIKNGINVEITGLSELVEELKNIEAKYVTNIFNETGTVVNDENISIFNETANYMEAFARIPSYVLGDVLNNNIEFNVEDITVEGAVKENILKSAQIAYDTLGTKPDRELGDSLKKAFTGIDKMLEDLELENSTDNQRAIRILAYNEMIIDEKNINDIKKLDSEVTKLIDNLTPRTTAYLIANGINPLKTDIQTLNKELDKINENMDTDEVEKYSEYLWKLEKNKEISKEDKDAYIGVYRLIRMVEKGDRKAIGAVMKQGSEVTMRSLLTAARSFNNTGNDMIVDDSLGLSDEVKLSDSNIDKQLDYFDSQSFLERAKKTTFDTIGANKAANNIEVNKSENNDTDTQTSDYDILRVEEVQSLQTISEETLLNIYEDGTVVNNSNILGLAFYTMNGGKTYSKIKRICDDEKVSGDLDKITKILDGTSNNADGTNVETEYYDLSRDTDGNSEVNTLDIDRLNAALNEMSGDIKEALMNKSHIDVKDIRSVNRMLNYVKRSAARNSYYVPANINGELSTVKITIETGESEKGKVTVRMKDSDINAEFTINDTDVKGLIMIGDNAIDNENYERFAGEFKARIENLGLNLKNLSKTDTGYAGNNRAYSKNVNKVTTSTLFKVAKEYISSIKKYAGQTDK